MLVDVRRTKHTRGRIADSHDLMYMHFIDTRDGKLHDFLEGIAEDTPLILFDDDGEGRSHGAAAELVLRYGMENRVAIVNGGIVALRDTDASRFLEDE